MVQSYIEESHTNVPPLRDEYSNEEDHKEAECSNPSIRHVWSRLVEPCLVLLRTLQSADTLLCWFVNPIHILIELTLVNFDVCALTAAKGVCSGSIESILVIASWIPTQGYLAKSEQRAFCCVRENGG